MQRMKKKLSSSFLTVLLALGLALSFISNIGFSMAQTPTSSTRRLVILGDSLTAGLGLDMKDSYPSLLQEKLDANGIKMNVINAGVSGDTSAGGLRRLDWLLREPVDILVVALGANDGLRGLPVEQMQENLRAIVKRTEQKYPQTKIILAGMLVPPNQGKEYATAFQEAFSRLAKSENVIFIPFLLEGVAGLADKNQPDGIHPNQAGQAIIAATLWTAIAPLTKKTDTN